MSWEHSHAAWASDIPTLQVKTVPLDLGNRHLAHLLPDADITAWQHGRDGLVGWGCAWRGNFPALHQFPAAKHAWQAIVAAATVVDEVSAYGTGLVAFGSFAFDPLSDAGAVLVIPRVIVGRLGDTAWLTTINCEVTPQAILGIVPDDSSVMPDGLGTVPDDLGTVPDDLGTVPDAGKSDADGSHFSSATETTEPHAPAHLIEMGNLRDGSAWAAAVEAVLERIANGDAEKVVLAREVVATAESSLSPTWLLQRLNSRFTSTWNYAIDSLVGATPEMLVRVEKGQVSSTVLTGTTPIPPGSNDQLIEALATDFINSNRDLVEHAHAVDTVANVLSSVCSDLSVVGPEILELPNVLHLISDISAQYASPGTPVTSLLLAELLHPSTAVCGAPTSAAYEIIREFEDFDRGRYSGPVGWINAEGDGEWGIALRCALIVGSQAHLYAACGIVPGSKPGVELMETEAKLNPLRWALAGDLPSTTAEVDHASASSPDTPKLHLHR